MAEISLAVTTKVIAYAAGAREDARLIAYSKATPDIASRLGEANKNHRMTLRIGGLLTLVVADSGGIWRAHNDEHVQDFEALFDFLAKYPSRQMRFLCEIIA